MTPEYPTPPNALQSWTAGAVREGKTEDNPKGGQLQKFYVDFKGHDGFQASGTYWRRKAGNVPEIGKSYAGTISANEHGYIFKIEPGGGTSSAGGSFNSSKRDWKPESERDPERSARILRQHSQEMAIRTMTAMGTFEGKSADLLHNTLTGWVDFFDKDVIQAASRGSEGPSSPQGADRGVNPGPEKQPDTGQAKPPSDDRQYLCKLLEEAGLGYTPAARLADFVLDRFRPDQVEKAKTGLHETRPETLHKLATAFEEAEGEVLPEAIPDDDIPF